MVKLKRLTIHRYRNVEPCELIFSDRRNVLLGPNGAGKTTLLSLISKILRTGLNDPGDPFSIELELTFPQGSLSGTIASREPKVERAELLNLPSMAGVGPEGVYAAHEVPDFQLALSLSEPRAAASIRRLTDRVVVEGTALERQWPLVNFQHSRRFLSGLLLLATLPLEGNLRADLSLDLKNACRFDESLDTFRAIIARQDDDGSWKDDLRPLIVRTKFTDHGPLHGEILTILIEGLVPKTIVDALEVDAPEITTSYSMNHEQLNFLSESVRLLGLRSAMAKMDLIDKRVREDTRSEHFELGNLKFWFTRRDGSIFQDQHLSYGQKRLLAFLYYLDANPSFVIADELVNGLHHAWIEECMTAIGDRQAFLTSQNPLLLDYMSFDSAEQVKESFILCRTQADGDRERMIWRNMTDDEADMFYRAYQVGIEHVGEILRTRGLW
ncbi:AAA family ATPase [Sorangium sp. So ce367]|uniref:AAA family ATPase n=1 Tax=Sorangium sp. So ce367 TaxID=3133305 RepID=UPI003F5D9994